MKYLILGAGPAGLTVANRLKQNGITDFLVLEKELEAGGLCRSQMVDESPLDIGGGHILDVRRKNVLDFLFEFMPENEWNIFDRVSKIQLIDGGEIDYPFEANIWQMPKEKQVEHLISISKAGASNEENKPESFREWIYWKLGEKIAEEYMIPYNSKIWSVDLNQLGTYWLEKLPDVSFRDTLMSCLERKPYGTLPGHAQFYYPKKFGYGEVWLRMANEIKDNIKYNVNVETIDFDTHKVNDTYEADIIINTLPWVGFKEIRGAGSKFYDNLKHLLHTSVVVKYFDEEVNTDSHWTYIPDTSKEHHRILFRSNFCIGSKGYWTETNLKRSELNDNHWHYVNDYAYPINSVGKNEAIEQILEEAKTKKVFGLGRWGEWQHYNSDVTVDLALKFTEKLLSEN